jgi:hypothetical protein
MDTHNGDGLAGKEGMVDDASCPAFHCTGDAPAARAPSARGIPPLAAMFAPPGIARGSPGKKRGAGLVVGVGGAGG